ncbi:hypothetical protein ACRCUN_05990 [Mycobacterium sp. LTG2003]
MIRLAGLLRGAADFVDALGQALDEQRSGFSEREAGDFLDASGLTDPQVPEDDDDVESAVITGMSLKLHRIRELANSWHSPGSDRLGHQIMETAANQLLNILNEGINFWTPPESEADDVVDAEVHCEGCKCPTICGCGREIYGEPESPDGPTYWFHRDDDSPITLQCARIPLAEPTAEELAELAAQGHMHVIPDPREVSHEDLAAHITGIQLSCLRRGMTVDTTYDEIASDLLADYRITKK